MQVSVDILSHQLAEMDASPDSYRETFVPAGAHGLVPDDLSERLSRAAGLRNVLVHMYEDIDYEIVAASIDAALENFGALVETFEKGLGEIEMSLMLSAR